MVLMMTMASILKATSRPMVNYQNDRELEEDYEIGWEWLE